MRKIWILLIFLASFFFDGLVAPAFIGFRESFLSFIFIVALFVYFGVDGLSVFYSIFFSLFLEFGLGLRFGVVLLPILIVAGILFFINYYFDISAVKDSRYSKISWLSGLGILLLFIFSVLYNLVACLLYGQPFIFFLKSFLPFSIFSFIYALAGFLAYFLIFKFLFMPAIRINKQIQ